MSRWLRPEGGAVRGRLTSQASAGETNHTSARANIGQAARPCTSQAAAASAAPVAEAGTGSEESK